MTEEVPVIGMEEQARVGHIRKFETHNLRIRVGQKKSSSDLGGDALMNSVKQIRNANYTDMQEEFDALYEGSRNGKSFDNLFSLITSEENILLAVRNLRANKGSKTPGVDRHTMKDLLGLSKEELVRMVKRKLDHYTPGAVKRVEIPKPNGKMRPLGIPSILDRLIQQCIYQVLAPICEARFHEYSNGFRPLRSTSTAMAQVYQMAQIRNLHHVVSIDIKGFFDNVNHKKLLRQMWNMGIRDKKVLSIVKAMLKAKIVLPDGELIKPECGTPQGGILSPLLANIVLNDLDWWISSQWETMKTRHEYKGKSLKTGTEDNSHKFRALRDSSHLKEMYIVRYADDFLIFCRNHKDAVKTKFAVEQWLMEVLKLETSPEKSRIINLEKEYLEYLGFKLKVVPKGQSWTVQSHISDKNMVKIEEKLREIIRNIQHCGTSEESHQAISYFNYYVFGIHSYYRIATHITIDCNKLDMKVRTSMVNRFRNRMRRPTKDDLQKYAHHYVVQYYGKSKQLRMVDGQPIIPIAYIQTSPPKYKRAILNLYTAEGRMAIHESKGLDISELRKVMCSERYNHTAEYINNRISRFVAQKGRCAITGETLTAETLHCHHRKPRSQGGGDEYENLIVVHEDIHRLIHATSEETIAKYLRKLTLSPSQLKKLNKLRKEANLSKI